MINCYCLLPRVVYSSLLWGGMDQLVMAMGRVLGFNYALTQIHLFSFSTFSTLELLFTSILLSCYTYFLLL